ncbi:hypothetical protein L2E82_41806 [Cichorium intybus]|uniref:Uncharacterized protein n=1 Tax=Cichorium intybus TaxID=13427 RepID=A0ACB8ZQD3_CICIN|nr:hypothetical protein L2E82_41806 [Cichorium intybus]
MGFGIFHTGIEDFILVWLPAPTVSLRPPVAVSAGIVAKYFSGCPDNAFQVALADTSYSFLQRIGAIVPAEKYPQFFSEKSLIGRFDMRLEDQEISSSHLTFVDTEVNDPSLDDIRDVLNPRFSKDQVLQPDKNQQCSVAVDASDDLMFPENPSRLITKSFLSLAPPRTLPSEDKFGPFSLGEATLPPHQGEFCQNRLISSEGSPDMTQKGLIYSFVAKGVVVLAEHTTYSGNVSTVAVQCLQKFPSGSNKYTYSFDGYTFNFLRDTGFGICNLIMLLNLVLSCLGRPKVTWYYSI